MTTGALFDTESDYSALDHDTLCTMQAGQLLSNGCLEYETAAYCSVYKKGMEIYYYISTQEANIKNFRQNARLNNIYHTPIRYFCQRFDVLDTTEEEINANFRLKLAKQLYNEYPDILFEAIEQLTAPNCTNDGFSLVQAMAEQLENGFDLNHLKLFKQLLDLLLEGRRINKEAYLIMQQWLQVEYQKMAIETIQYGSYKRQYSGFVYEKINGVRGTFIDAVLHITEERQTQYRNMGYLVTPILDVTYYSDHYLNPIENKELFIKELHKYLNDDYLKLMRLFNELPATVDKKQYQLYEKQILATGKQAAIEAFQYFGHVCNVF